MNKKIFYRHVFSKEGRYIGCRKVTTFDMVKPYLFTVFGIGALIGLIYVAIHDSNINISRQMPQTILEIPLK
jgi:hypothetical protein